MLRPAPMAHLTDVWQTFRKAPHTLVETPGVREAWNKGRPYYAVWVLRIACPKVVARASFVADALGRWLHPQPVADLHVTLGVAGFPCGSCRFDDDVDEATLVEQAARIKARNLETNFHVHGICAFLTAPFLVVTDDQGGFAALREIIDPPGRALYIDRYLPHVTVGRWNGQHATNQLMTALQPLQDLQALSVQAKHVELVQFASADPFAPLVTRLSVPLGQR